jgi:transcriptional regulator
VTGVRAESTYAGARSTEVQNRIAVALAERDGPRDTAAREHLLRRLGT